MTGVSGTRVDVFLLNDKEEEGTVENVSDIFCVFLLVPFYCVPTAQTKKKKSL